MEHNAEISENTQQESVPVMKRTIKDSVFTNLFKDKKYLIQLYQALHPDDKQTTENDIKDDVGVKRVFRNSLTSYIVP